MQNKKQTNTTRRTSKSVPRSAAGRDDRRPSRPRTGERPRSDDRRPSRPRTDERPRSDDRRPARPRTDERPRSDDRRPSRPRTDERPRNDDRRPSRPRTDERPRNDDRQPSRPRTDERPRNDDRRPSRPRTDERPRNDDRRPSRLRTEERPRSDDRRPARPRTDERPRNDDRRPSRPRTDERPRNDDRRPSRPRTEERPRNDDRRPFRRTEIKSRKDERRPQRSFSSRTQPTFPTHDIRLNRAIADAGVASRRKADELISAGQVTINGKVCTELGYMVGIDDVVSVNGEPITRYKHLTYVLLNKPKDVITTASDEFGRTTVFDIVRLKTRLFTVGRLDRNTTGVLLLTNDGELCNRLMHPRYGIPRMYNATLDRPIEAKHAAAIAAGIELDDGPSQPCEVFIDPRDAHKVSIQIKEGRNREVRRIFEAMGYDVRKLDRKQYAFLTTRGLARGIYRHLTREEVFELQKLVKLEKSTATGSRKGKRS